MRKRQILFAGSVARMEIMRLPKSMMVGELVGGTSCAGEQENEGMRCLLLGDLRAFGTNTDQCRTTAAQGKGEWRETAKQGSERFMAKWIAAEKARAGLRHAAVCSNVTGRAKGRIAQSKLARAGSLASDSSLATSVVNLYTPGVFVCRCNFAFLWRYVSFSYFCFEAAAVCSIILRWTKFSGANGYYREYSFSLFS